MVLKIPVKKPAVPVAAPAVRLGVRPQNSAAFKEAAKPAVNPVAPAAKEIGDPKTVSVRLPPSHFEMLEEIKTMGECDKTEAVKRSIRLTNAALRSHDAVLHLTDESGNVTKIPIMVKGRLA